MPDKSSIKMAQTIDENGELKGEMPEMGDEELKKMYEMMVFARRLDDTILKLQREGRSGTYASSLGQEATQVGSALALKRTDWMFPYFREIGAHLVRGLPMHLYLLYWMGDERGSKVPENINDFMIAVPVSTQIPHAVGAAMAAKIKKDGNVVMVYFSDGATSKGDFHEAMNFAGVFKSPVVFVCQNNQWAISIPVKKQTASETIAQKAQAYGFDGVLVDGNDVLAVYKATSEAVEKARRGEGPTLIECLTYRMSDHTTADDASKYRPEEELESWKKKDSIERFKKFLKAKGILSEESEKQISEKIAKQIDDIVKKAESEPPASPSDIFDYLYEKMPKELQDEKERFLEDAGGKK
jgi:pyruvate dehydrogenase E1 component alpha subunit